jgi:cytochrome P450
MSRAERQDGMTQTPFRVDGGLPFERATLFGPPEPLEQARLHGPVVPMRFPDGHEGWLVVGHAEARMVLSDPRFSAQADRKHPPLPVDNAAVLDPAAIPPGQFVHMDPPEHTRFRKLLAAQFTVRRLTLLEPRIEQICAERIEAMRAAGPPCDLVTDYALAIPTLVICELLGVPWSARDRFEADTELILSIEAAREDSMAALGRVMAFLAELVRDKRSAQGDDLLSGLVGSGALTEEEIVGAALLLLVAGHETSANMLSLGMFALLRHPDQLAALRAGEVPLDSAVLELLRYLSVVHFGTQRVAKEDIEVGDVLVRAGQAVQVHLPAADRDPRRYPDPDRLDLSRDAGAHLAFGHGLHLCLGAQLARVELRIGYGMLLKEFPDLRLAVPPEEVVMRTGMGLYGVHALPVTW